jgi:catechol 2,3-dioxygenase-like lactoylglutathione lyase family enzyme
MATFTGMAHVAFTVSDMEASAEWWRTVLGFQRLRRIDEPPTGQRHPRILTRHPPSGLVLGLHEPHGRSGDRFEPARTGLDHISLAVTDRAALVEWIAHLEGLGLAHSPIRSFEGAEFISLEDRDGIQIELWAPRPTRT